MKSAVAAFLIAGLAGLASAQPYRNVTVQAGLGGVLRANGVAAADIDLDGDLDLYVVSPEERLESDPATWNHLFRNRGDGTFEDITAASGIEAFDGGYRRGQQGNRFGAAWGDFDGDRYPDLFMARIGPDRLFRNLGDGTFEDVTVLAGVFGTDDTANDVAGAWSDLDGDGDLDLYVSAWIGPNRLYLNNGDGTFVESAKAVGLADRGFTWGALPWDINRDGRLDLYVVNDFGPNHLYIQGDGGLFTDETAAFGLEDEGNGMGVALADVNEDGFPDIYVTNIADRAPNPLFLGGPDGFVEDAAGFGIASADWAWGVEFFDADLDGDQDLYAVTGFPTEPATNRLFERRESLTGDQFFVDVSEGSGADGFPEARGLVVFDSEGDGDLDLFVANFRSQSALLERTNVSRTWIGFWLDSPGGNRWGVGAQVTVQSGGKTFRRYMDGIDFLGQSLLPAHFGLDREGGVDRVVVTWPDGSVESWTDLNAGRYHTLSKGTSTGVESEVARPIAWAPYPTPASTHVFLPISGQVDVFDLLGRLIARRVADSNGRVILGDLPSGVLFLVGANGRAHLVLHE
ncbi:MAG: hypothetical protein ACI80V_001026 [Rhodothermales bacterium]|jgi:hypothetical protein